MTEVNRGSSLHSLSNQAIKFSQGAGRPFVKKKMGGSQVPYNYLSIIFLFFFDRNLPPPPPPTTTTTTTTATTTFSFKRCLKCRLPYLYLHQPTTNNPTDWYLTSCWPRTSMASTQHNLEVCSIRKRPGGLAENLSVNSEDLRNESQQHKWCQRKTCWKK